MTLRERWEEAFKWKVAGWIYRLRQLIEKRITGPLDRLERWIAKERTK